jgi:hypothetical protein
MPVPVLTARLGCGDGEKKPDFQGLYAVPEKKIPFNVISP